MIHQKTVFVMGAGTGVEYGMPKGSDLAEVIHTNLGQNSKSGQGGYQLFDSRIEQILNSQHKHRAGEYKAAAKKIRDGVLLARSIDELLETYASEPSVIEVGKWAIVSAILDAEANSKLFVQPSSLQKQLAFSEVKGSWLSLLFQLMASGISHAKPEAIFEQITFINFNYDRCLEHFFVHAVASRFGAELIEAAKMAGNVRIIHPYGYLGKINPSASGGNAQFGHSPNMEVGPVSSGIRIYTEQFAADEQSVREIRQEISNAELIVFLGFAFHDQNLKLITPPEGIKARRILATSLGMSELDTTLTKDWMKSLQRNVVPVIEIEADTCANFVRRYQKSIAR
jgi:hypothetical protein